MSLEQERAGFALGKIDQIKNHQDKSSYKTQLLKLPARLHTSGLGQTVAFYLSAGKRSAEADICQWLGEWLVRLKIYPAGDLIRNIVGQPQNAMETERSYRMASAEARALSVWLKRFAEAYIGDAQ